MLKGVSRRNIIMPLAGFACCQKGNESIMGKAQSKQAMINVSLCDSAHVYWWIMCARRIQIHKHQDLSLGILSCAQMCLNTHAVYKVLLNNRYSLTFMSKKNMFECYMLKHLFVSLFSNWNIFKNSLFSSERTKKHQFIKKYCRGGETMICVHRCHWA